LRSTNRRVAWLGPTPSSSGGGVAYAGLQFLRALSERNIEVDCFLACSQGDVPDALRELSAVRVHTEPSGFAYAKWYSRGDLSKLVSGAVFNGRAQAGLARTVAREHERRHYDFVYQFSHLETTALRRFRRRLPPLVLHPEVHAAGELRWLLKERALALGGGSRRQYAVGLGYLAARAATQRAGVRMADRVVAPSERFAELLAQDLALAPERLRVVPNPIDIERYVCARTEPDDIARILFVSRIAVRKGVDQVVALADRLRDLRGEVHIDIVGDRSFFSDYRHLLADLDPQMATYLGPLSSDGVRELYAGARLLVQPSRYEPFGLCVGEALAAGIPVVATDEVGAAEDIDAKVCRRVEPGNPDALERAVRELLDTTSDPVSRADLGERARQEAVRRYDPDVVGERLDTALYGS
jgi:glycosyltransferase involved in cell wall biosynthesis